MTQLTRYRHDYRNPSTHDYKLDFDEDEAILAIVAVCAFSKLLVDQIADKIAFDDAVNVTQQNQDTRGINVEANGVLLARTAFEFLRKSGTVNWSRAAEAGLAGAFHANGFSTADDVKIPHLGPSTWDIFAEKEDEKFGVETRIVGDSDDLDASLAFFIVRKAVLEGQIESGLVVYFEDGEKDLHLYHFVYNSGSVFVLSRSGLDRVGSLDAKVEPLRIS